jgi:pyroglutamyl-peptidase
VISVLITGFARFPGSPINPSGAIARRLARVRRPAFANARLIAKVCPTHYAAIDRQLPRLMAEVEPDVVLMFGLASRTTPVRIERQARNRMLTRFPDASGFTPRTRAIRTGAAPSLRGRAPMMRLLAATRGLVPKAVISRNAGSYVCNYAYWRALEGAAEHKPAVIVFVHVPMAMTGRRPRPRSRRRKARLEDLVRVGEAILAAVIAAATSPGQASAMVTRHQ